ncbi:hypothetical protein WJX74_007858 [Apatococcus lobatus]|uniref:Uncharacterized protein n=1 Tax=Apatococcus lobatus TaxID=904363 RepID=A0AAW1R163_9CHLO
MLCSKQKRHTGQPWAGRHLKAFQQGVEPDCSPATATPSQKVPKTVRAKKSFTVDVTEAGQLQLEGPIHDSLFRSITQDAEKLMQAAGHMISSFPGNTELSVVLCDDCHIQDLNREHRGKDAPTDVLSFPMGDDDFPALEAAPVVLGDLIISLDTAQQQASQRGHTLQDEVRILMVHGLLHLLGHDHELGAAAHNAMAAAEASIMSHLGWKGEGLIAAADNGSVTSTPGNDSLASQGSATSPPSTCIPDSQTSKASTSADPSSSASTHSEPGAALPACQRSVTTSTSSIAPASSNLHSSARSPWPRTRRLDRKRDLNNAQEIKLLAIDMDGTLLDGNGLCLPSSVKALEAAIAKGVFVCLATGKARPAAIKAMTIAGLAGKGRVVSKEGPGIFLQGLAVYDRLGVLEKGKNLDSGVVRQAFLWSLENDVPLQGFTGDEAVTLKMQPELEELHIRYYEPLAEVKPSIDALLAGLPVKKLLFMTDPARIEALVKPHWMETLVGSSAETTQACPDMLEVVSAGVNKWTGMQSLMASLGVPQAATMAMGDGMNDYPIVSQAAIGIAMGNAHPEVKAAATYVVSDNNTGGVAEAVERFILDGS